MTRDLRLQSVIDGLPSELDMVRAEAVAEGCEFLERLHRDWMTAIGGLSLDPVVGNALRMRRFYVRRSFRRDGVGRAMVMDLLERDRQVRRMVTVNAGRGSSGFWEACGFVPDQADGHTHVVRD